MDIEDSDILSKYREKIITWIAGASLLFILPFALNNLYNGRWMVGVSSIFVLCVLIANVVAIRRGTKPLIDMLALLPAISAFLALCFYKQGIIAVFWSYPAVILFYFLLPPRQARFCNATLLTLVIPASCVVMPPALAARVAATQMGVSVLCGIFIHLIWLQQQELQRCAVTDALTGVYNRLQLERFLAQAQARKKRYDFNHTLLALDIDFFKSVNDNHGHAAGDEVLKGLAVILQDRTRGSDSIFRIGGEEFLILLENTTMSEGIAVAEELRQLVEDSTLLGGRQITVSIGVAELSLNDSAESWMKRADENLYWAKAEGRNRVVGRLEEMESSAESMGLRIVK